jgi:hypothetical protein
MAMSVERYVGDVAPERFGHRLDHDAMIVALGQTGDGNGADATRALEQNRNTPPVDCIVALREGAEIGSRPASPAALIASPISHAARPSKASNCSRCSCAAIRRMSSTTSMPSSSRLPSA